MNEEIINRWNKTVKKKDTFYVLGDIAKKKYIGPFKRLNEIKILVLGNHDVNELKILMNDYID